MLSKNAPVDAGHQCWPNHPGEVEDLGSYTTGEAWHHPHRSRFRVPNRTDWASPAQLTDVKADPVNRH